MPTTLSPRAEDAARAAGPALFGFEATRGDDVVMRVAAFAAREGGVFVEALVWNVRALTPQPPATIGRMFAALDKATAFVDETAICLEYAGCSIAKLDAP